MRPSGNTITGMITGQVLTAVCRTSIGTTLAWLRLKRHANEALRQPAATQTWARGQFPRPCGASCGDGRAGACWLHPLVALALLRQLKDQSGVVAADSMDLCFRYGRCLPEIGFKSRRRLCISPPVTLVRTRSKWFKWVRLSFVSARTGPGDPEARRCLGLPQPVQSHFLRRACMCGGEQMTPWHGHTLIACIRRAYRPRSIGFYRTGNRANRPDWDPESAST